MGLDGPFVVRRLVSFFDDAFVDDGPPWRERDRERLAQERERSARERERTPPDEPTQRIPIVPPRAANPPPPATPREDFTRSTRSRSSHSRDQDAQATARHSRRAEPPVAPPSRHARPLPEQNPPPRPLQPSRAAAGTSPRGRRRRGRSMLWRVGTTATAFTVVLILAAGGIAGLVYEKYNHQLKRVSVLQTHDPHIRNAARQQHAENFLIIGSDTRAGANAKYGNAAGARSDTTILVHLSPSRAKATVISIPRDSWVEIPECTGTDGNEVAAHSEMFNSAFAIGGPTCTIKTVQKLTGIAVTHFIEIDFSGFVNMIKALPGHSVTVCSPQVVNDPYSGLKLHPGDNRLSGANALAYVRARETIGDGSDLGRIKRQQNFLGAVLRQAMDGSMMTSPTRLTSFLDAATKAITVDKSTSFGDLRTLAASMQGLDPKRVTFYTAPIANQNYTPPGTTMTGRVLLDEVQGRILYDSVINDKKPVWIRKADGTSKVVPSTHPSVQPPSSAAHLAGGAPPAGAPHAATPAPSPKPSAGTNAGHATCSL
jgi:LCP family protein required for cell wall assembly